MQYTSSVYKQSDGAWRAVIRWREDGKEKRKTKRLKAKTKTAARSELRDWERSLNIDETEDFNDLSFTGYASRYIDSLEVTNSIEPVTAEGYRDFTKRISHQFGDTPMSSITATDVQRWVETLVDDGLSSVTIRKTVAFAKQVFKHAMTRGDAAKNPFEGVRTPKLKTKRPNSLDAAGRQRLKDWLALSGLSRLTVAASIALYTGMRQGEICGLRWGDVNLENSTLWVRQAIGRKKGGGIVKKPKTEKMRDIPLPGALVKTLTAWRDHYEQECKAAGVVLLPSMYVIGQIDGRYMQPDVLSKSWLQVARSMNLEGTECRRVTFHDLRHTYATAAIAAGVDVKTVSSILGHANASMTLNIYASADPDAKRAAANKMDSII